MSGGVPRAARVLALAFLNGACGGAIRELPEEAGVADGGLETGDAAPRGDAAGDADASVLEACGTPERVRICGGVCPSLGQDACKGVGCQPLLDRVSNAPTGVGVCVPDLPIPLEQCGRCPDGDVCANISGEGTVCVPEQLCQRLTELGFANGCRYADFSPYDGQPLAIARGADCPSKACGPACGPCRGAYDRCIGRSARHGYGMCVETSDWVPCNPSLPLPRTCAAGNYSCVAWAPPAPNDTASLAYGFCAPRACGTADARLVCAAP